MIPLPLYNNFHITTRQKIIFQLDYSLLLLDNIQHGTNHDYNENEE